MNQIESHEIKGNQFPFGLLNDGDTQSNKILVKKRYKYKNQTEFSKLQEKIEKLKTISHKNTINLRYVQDNQDEYIDLFYPYVAISLEDAFNQESEPSVKDLHKQFISLAIYLAKNYILTSFNPNRCGVVFNERKYIIKYYLPLNEIIVTENLSMLERSVQLFNLQSMHYLDTLCHSGLNSSRDSSSRSSFIQSKNKLSPNPKKRKQSQPILGLKSVRKFSTSPNLQQIRKLSNLSKQLSEFSQMRNRRITKESTRISGASFSTFKNILSLSQKSQKDAAIKILISESKTIIQRVQHVKQRSVLALKQFLCLRKRIQEHRSLSLLISKISH